MKKLMKVLKLVKPLDWIIAVMGMFLLIMVDFDNVTLVNVIYMTVLLMWFLMLLVRLCIQYNKSSY